MALIKCPECNKEISDKAEICIHCGYPINRKTYAGETINGIAIDMDFLKDKSISQVEKIRTIKDKTGCDLMTAKNVVLKYHPSQQVQKQTTQSNVPKCPTCSSTNIQRIGTGEKVVSGALWGLFSNKVHKTYKCNNCKHMW